MTVLKRYWRSFRQETKTMADYAFERINTVDSTNTELKRRINASFGMKTSVLIADEQTAGRGRRGRVWLNTDGALLMSICIPLKGINPDLIPLISLTAAIAANEAIADLRADKHKMTRNTGIKWPNDILISGFKVAGILSEAANDLRGGSYAVVGIGINVNAAGIPDGLNQPASSLRLLYNRDFDRISLGLRIADRLTELADMLKAGCDKTIIKLYSDNCITLGRAVEVIRNDGSRYEAEAVEIDSIGRLVVSHEDGNIEAIDSADVSIRWLTEERQEN